MPRTRSNVFDRLRHDPPVSAKADRPRIVLYSHDTLGYGHLRRNLLLAGALRRCAGSPDILMIAGMREAGTFPLPAGVDCVTLPAYAKDAQGQYATRDLSIEIGELGRIRAAMIRATVAAFAPDLMVVDNVPRGAQYELDPVLKHLRKSGRTRLVLGLRDVIDDPATTRRQWLRQRNFEALRDFYSDVWIYGDAELYETASEYGITPGNAAPVTYTGYLDQRDRLGTTAAQQALAKVVGADPRPYVLCSVGGGRDGAALCEAFATTRLPAGHRGILITGSQMPTQSRQRIAGHAAARDNLTVIDFLADPIGVAAQAAAVVGMGGYNTTTEMLSLGRPALIVPRVRPRAEQLLRASLLADRGLVDMIHPDTVTPEKLAAWLDSAIVRPRGATADLDMGGLDRVRRLADAALSARDTAFRKIA
jgi:predicted glycosyltransferase